MPIKFRCQHCRQFLGISRTKAGEIVDCPTCGRTLRVPRLDGKVVPLPQLKLDLKDSALAHAMDELAALGEVLEEEPASVSSPSASQYALAHNHARDEIEIPDAPSFYHGKESSPPLVPAPQVVEMTPLAPPELIKIQPAEPQKTKQIESVASKEFVSTEIEQLAKNDLSVESFSQKETFSSRSTLKSIRQKVNRSIAFIAVSFFVGLLLGWLGGPFFSSKNYYQKTELQSHQKNRQNQNGIAKKGEQIPATSSSQKPSIQGRVTYQTERQSTRPDKGACVIVLPESRQGEAKIPYIGFRGGDFSTDFKMAEAALHVLGGDAAIVDDKGEYEIHLPESGKYHVITISHFQSRDESLKVDAALRGLLRGYFDRPEQLLGNLAYRFDGIYFDGEETELKDITFNRRP